MVYSIDEIKNILTPVAKAFGVERIYLFGSYAKGYATEQSDLDMRIDKGLIKGLVLCTFQIELEDKLGKKIDLVTTESLDQEFLDEISGDEVLLYAG